jgi:type IV secretory pathway VirB10-like protein
MKKQHLLLKIAVTTVFFLFAPCANAQSYRYIDEAGNIIFVDSISEIPSRYRYQVIPPTPVPVMDQKTRAKHNKMVEKRRREVEAKKVKEQRTKEQQKRQLEREKKARERLEERERKAAEREKSRGQKK